jgi:hypothetical protein
MDVESLWHVLVMDWTKVENTPPSMRRPLELQRWHLRVERLARMMERSSGDVVRELKEQARAVAHRKRREMEASLAEDFAVCRAQGLQVKPPWRRKLQALAEITGQERETVQQRVIDAAASIQVVEAR